MTLSEYHDKMDYLKSKKLESRTIQEQLFWKECEKKLRNEFHAPPNPASSGRAQRELARASTQRRRRTKQAPAADASR